VVELVVIGFLAGVVAGISPCILPVLPVVLAAGITTPGAAGSWWSPRARPFAVVAGLVLSFSVLVLAGSELLSLLGLPQSLLQAVGVVLLVAVGVGLLIPSVGVLLERPFARLRVRPPDGRAGGFVMGLGLGLLFVPCAGPVLAAITVAGATHQVGLTAVALTLAFAAGAAVPLMAAAIAGSQLQRCARFVGKRSGSDASAG
jgi:cytochrome c biogenesis protein CcdA